MQLVEQKDGKKGYKKDFSCSDRKFAANIGVKFHTPEELFLEEKPVEFEWGTIDPAELLKNAKAVENTKFHSDKQEVVIMVGRPASGKSTFTKKYFVPHGYIRINRDELKTQAKCQKAVKDALAEGCSVVVDNTNPTSKVRAEYISIAQENDVPVRCFSFSTPQEVAGHLNYVRVKETNGEVRRVPDVGHRTYDKNFEEPTTDEGFSEIKVIDFVPDFSHNPKLEQIFSKWT